MKYCSLMTGKWITAKDALELVSKAVGSHAAHTVIAKRARAGLVESRAKRLLIGKKIKDNANIPEDFWWAGGEAALEQSWGSGDFSTWIDQKHHLQAFGVTFRRSDIEALAGIVDTDDKWISARLALQAIETMGGGSQFGVAFKVLDYLRVGHIEAKADAMQLTIKDRYGTTHDESANSELTIPDWFWNDCTAQDRCVLDWQSGTFSGRGYVDGDTVQAKFLGVKLRASDLSVFANDNRTTPDADLADPESVQNPSLSNSELNQWWESKADVRDSLSQDELVTLVRHKYPDKHISRDRVRDLTGPRKRGPKQSNGKSTAK